MKNLILICLFFFVITCKGQLQGNQWLRQYGGMDADYCEFVSVDIYDNVVTVGEFFGVANFGTASSPVSFTSNGYTDIVISKLNAKGSAFWVIQIGGSGYDGAYDLVVDPAGNIFVSGQFKNTVDFDPGPATYDVTATATLQANQFIVKLDLNGNFEWVKTFESSSITALIDQDANGNIYVSGPFTGTADFDPGPGVTNLTAAYSYNLFILKLDAQGNFKWVKQVGSYSHIFGTDVHADMDGNVVSVGYYRDTITRTCK